MSMPVGAPRNIMLHTAEATYHLLALFLVSRMPSGCHFMRIDTVMYGLLGLAQPRKHGRSPATLRLQYITLH